MAKLKTRRLSDLCVVWKSCGVAEKANGGDIPWTDGKSSPFFVGDLIHRERSRGDDEQQLE